MQQKIVREPESRRQWIVCQLGARENYMVARALASSGQLAALVTDVWQAPDSLAGRINGRLKERYHPQLAGEHVEAPRYAYFARELGARYLGDAGWRRIMARNAWFEAMAARRLRSIVTRRGPCDTVFAYSYAAGAIFRAAKSLGMSTVLGQIDPGPMEDEIVADLYRQAGQSARYERIPSDYWSRWRDEIAQADIIVANSEWSKSALIQSGVPRDRIRVVPLACDAPAQASSSARLLPQRFTPERPLRLLFLGQVTLRKGIGPLLEAMQRMPTAAVRLDIVGEVQAEIPGTIAADSRIAFHGATQRSAVHRYYEEADLFVFPTFSDGFGITQLESLAHGLPVLTSRHCGAVVEHDVNGFVLDDVTPEAIEAVLSAVIAEPSRIGAWSRNARVPIANRPDALARHLSQLSAVQTRLPL